jgi:CheY-like chemotaxis protein
MSDSGAIREVLLNSFNQIPLALVAWQSAGTTASIVEWNGAAEGLFGWSKAEALGRDPWELLAPGKGDRPNPDPARIDAALPPVCRTRDEDTVTIRWHHTARNEEHGGCLVASFGEHLDPEQVPARDAHEADARPPVCTDSARTCVLARMSHDIRTPLNGILGMTGLLFDSPLTTQQRENIETIRQCADQLLDTFNNILREIQGINGLRVSGEQGSRPESAPRKTVDVAPQTCRDGRPAASDCNGHHPRLRILLAEDNLINQKIATSILEKNGFRVDLAKDGAAVLEALQVQDYDLILMDVEMPVMDGCEATRRIRHQEKYTGGRLPIVALTAYDTSCARERCLAVGMDVFLTKPISPAVLVETIRQLLN